MRILEKFWYGNVEPTEYATSSCKEYKEALQLIARNKKTSGHHNGRTEEAVLALHRLRP